MPEPSGPQIAATRKHTDTLARATLALQELAVTLIGHGG
jgi:hypothetical protein